MPKLAYFRDQLQVVSDLVRFLMSARVESGPILAISTNQRLINNKTFIQDTVG